MDWWMDGCIRIQFFYKYLAFSKTLIIASCKDGWLDGWTAGWTVGWMGIPVFYK